MVFVELLIAFALLLLSISQTTAARISASPCTRAASGTAFSPAPGIAGFRDSRMSAATRPTRSRKAGASSSSKKNRIRGIQSARDKFDFCCAG